MGPWFCPPRKIVSELRMPGMRDAREGGSESVCYATRGRCSDGDLPLFE